MASTLLYPQLPPPSSHIFNLSLSTGFFLHLQAHSGILQHFKTPTLLFPASLCSSVCTPPGIPSPDEFLRAAYICLCLPDTHPPLHCLPSALAWPLKHLFPRRPLTAYWWPFLNPSLSLIKPDTPFHFISVISLDTDPPLCPRCYWPPVRTLMISCLQLIPNS